MRHASAGSPCCPTAPSSATTSSSILTRWTSSRSRTGRTSGWRPPTADLRAALAPAYAPRVPTSLLWFRRDLRLSDHPALLAAVDAAGQDGDVVGVFVVDPRLWEPAGEP